MKVSQALLAQGIEIETVKKVIQYHENNPGLFKLFEAVALDVGKRGKKVGAMAIVNKIRWDTEIESDGVFKINNNIAPYYARIFALKYPQYAFVFETRKAEGCKELA